jgi:2-polyprenyl-3-methyl-5-hydroxy-6-metoxy-1,4-benzoquinol methylase
VISDMPSSQMNQIPKIVSIVEGGYFKPEKILDCGAGNGKYGFLFREILQHWHNLNPQIDAIEGHREYIGDLQCEIYDDIYTGEAIKVLEIMDKNEYDLILAIDILEHFEKDEGKDFLFELSRVGKNVLVSTPKNPIIQKDICDNPLEIHRSRWTIKELKFWLEPPFKIIKEPMNHIVLSGPAVNQLNGHHKDRLKHFILTQRDKIFHPIR